MIPKIIHQIWMQGEDNIPQKYYNNIKKIKNMHPDWKYILWDEIKILEMIKNDMDLLNAYYKFTHLHQKIDFGRYIMLYYYGGVYLDMDSYSIKPLDSLLDKFSKYDLIVSKINLKSALEAYPTCASGWCINNGIVLSIPKSIVLGKIIEAVIKNPSCGYSTKFSCIQNTTGPTMFTKIIKKYINENPNQNDVIVLNPDYLEPCVLENCEITENTYTIHAHDGSWYDSTTRNFGKFYMNNKILVWILIISLIIVLYLLCTKYWHKIPSLLTCLI